MARGLSTRAGAALGLAVGLVLMCGAALAGPKPEAAPRITEIQPLRSGELLVCRLASDGLPGDKILSTLSSGLVSAVEIHLELMSEANQPKARRSYEIRLSFDLWEEVYTVHEAGNKLNFVDLPNLKAYLAVLPPLVLARLDDLLPGERYTVTAGLKLHPLAPDARGRMQEMVSGGQSAGRGSDDGGQEVSVSLGRLIRFFYRGGSSREDLVGAFQSRSFTMRELDDVSN